MGDLRAAPVVGPSGRGSAPPSRPNDLNSTTKITHSIFFYPSVSTFSSAAIATGMIMMDWVGNFKSGRYEVYGDLLPQAIINNNFNYFKK